MPGSSRKKLVRTYIDPVILAAYKAQFPMTASISWVLEEGMRSVLAITDGQPSLQSLVRSAIRQSILRHHIKSGEPNAGQPDIKVEPVG
jgi:hypothetical protein